MSNIQIKNEKLTVTIAERGAELQSIVDENGVERLWNGDPAFWTGRAPVLFPVAGGFRNDGYELNGKWYEMPKHGIVRKQDWTVKEQKADEATFAISLNTEGFPFAYELNARYSLSGSTLKVEYIVKNLDTQDFWFSCGSHEAYACPEGIENYQILFDEPETVENHELVGNLIKREGTVMGENVTVFGLKESYFAVDALVFPNLKARAVTLASPLHGRRVRVEYPECSVLMLWTKPGAGYICIEPWRNNPDYVDADLDITKKRGFVCLKPGEVSTTVHTISIL